MALILAVGSVADFFGESEIGVLQRAHQRRVHADVENFQAIRIARGIQHAVERFGVGARASVSPSTARYASASTRGAAGE